MRRPPRLALPVLLLASATLAIGAIVYGLLWKESLRLRESSLASARQQAATVAENLSLTVAEIKTALMQALLAFEGPAFEPQLRAWQQEDPFVAFAFTWRNQSANTLTTFPPQPLVQPNLEQLLRANAEQWIWQAPPAPPSAAAPALAESAAIAADAVTLDAPASSNFADNTYLRQSIRSQGEISTRLAKKTMREERTAWTADSNEWIHQTIDGQRYWIGFVRWNNGSVISGAAVKLADLDDVLAKSFPSQLAPSIEQLYLVDPSESIVARARPPRSYKSSPDSLQGAHALPVGPELPGWSLRLQADADASLAAVLASPPGLATTALLLGLVLAGLWLVGQTRASQVDAARKVSFVSNVSHELKTPLTTIRMYSELLQSGRVADAEKQTRYLDTISGEAQRLARLVNNVLDFSRLERGKAKLDCRPQPVAPVLEDYLDMRRRDIESTGFALETDVDRDIHADFDRDALCQILGNLIDNSLKYARHGKWLRIRLHPTQDHALLSLSDKGPGLPRALRRGDFRAFERGDESLVAESSGFGLGLSIAQSLAREMKAELRYQHPNSSDQYPTFTLALPRA